MGCRQSSRVLHREFEPWGDGDRLVLETSGFSVAELVARSEAYVFGRGHQTS